MRLSWLPLDKTKTDFKAQYEHYTLRVWLMNDQWFWSVHYEKGSYEWTLSDVSKTVVLAKDRAQYYFKQHIERQKNISREKVVN